VVSRTSAFFFKGKPADVHEIGAKLHVAFVVEGSVRKEGGQLKVTAQLIRTDDGYHVWSGSFERQSS
jgi:TolB-like protein